MGGCILQQDQPRGNKNPLPSRLHDPSKSLSFSDILYKSKQIKTGLIRLPRSKELAARKKAPGGAPVQRSSTCTPCKERQGGGGVSGVSIPASSSGLNGVQSHIVVNGINTASALGLDLRSGLSAPSGGGDIWDQWEVIELRGPPLFPLWQARPQGDCSDFPPISSRPLSYPVQKSNSSKQRRPRHRIPRLLPAGLPSLRLLYLIH